MRLSRLMAQFAYNLTQDNVPSAVLEKAKVCLLNGYGIALGCKDTPYAPVARQAALAMYGQSETNGATLLGDGRKTVTAGASLANAALFHGRAQEDTCGAAHIGSIVIPMLTAMIEADGYSVDRLLISLIAGYEIGGLLEKQYAGLTTPSGFRSSALYGTIAAAAAASKLMDLPPEQFESALANAASFTGGTLQSFADGTDEWRYQVGVAAQTGYTAAQLASAGSVTAPNAFEGSSGFVRAFTRTDCDVCAVTSSLGKDWSTLRVTFKPFPVCAFNQTPVTAALILRSRMQERNVSSSSIARIEVRMNPYETGYAGMDSMGPFNSISGTLMSIPFCIANSLLYGAPDMHRMTTYDDDAVTKLMARVDLISDESVNKLCCGIKVDIKDQEPLVQEQIMTVSDFAYSRTEISALIRRVGSESAIEEDRYRRLEAFIDNPKGRSIQEVVSCFH